MNKFQLMIFESALTEVRTEDDARSLAEMLMKVTEKASGSKDPFWYTCELQLLSGLIWHEANTGNRRSFSNIRQITLDGNLKELLRSEEPRLNSSHIQKSRMPSSA